MGMVMPGRPAPPKLRSIGAVRRIAPEGRLCRAVSATPLVPDRPPWPAHNVFSLASVRLKLVYMTDLSPHRKAFLPMSKSDPLRIFRPGSPIPAVLTDYLMATVLPALPGYIAAAPARQAELRLAAMHLIAAYDPQDALEMMLAANMVATRAQAVECMRFAADPAVEDAAARRHKSLGSALLRCHDGTLAVLRGTHARRRKEAAAQAKDPVRQDSPWCTAARRPWTPEHPHPETRARALLHASAASPGQAHEFPASGAATRAAPPVSPATAAAAAPAASTLVLSRAASALSWTEPATTERAGSRLNASDLPGARPAKPSLH
jgi:hypothetical protein